MLQIVTGRFFGDGRVNEREFDANFYANFNLISPLETEACELRPASTRGASINSFVLRYRVRYEPTPQDILIMPFGDEVSHQFRLLAGLWFEAFFHPDRYHVEKLCRQDVRHSTDSVIPSRFVEKFFDVPKNLDTVRAQTFPEFIRGVTQIPRRSYKLFISCLNTYFDALEAIDTNLDLAYSMFVYVLEGLTQGSDGFEPTWSDFPLDSRTKIDEQLKNVPAINADAIRAILGSNPHLKLMKRFVGFTESLIDESFFTLESVGRDNALRKNELKRALENLYQSRSGYVHSLKKIKQNLRLADFNRNSDVFSWSNEPHLTFSGVSRLCRHVLIQYIESQKKSDSENYPEWRREIPGIISAELAPQLWVGKFHKFQPEFITKHFNGFLADLIPKLNQTPIVVLDVRSMVEEMENHFATAKKPHKGIMICFYCLVHYLLSEEFHRPNWEKFIQKYRGHLETCSIFVMASLSIFAKDFPWPIEECVEEFEKYEKRKFKKNAINLPKTLEVAIVACIANLFLKDKDLVNFRDWVTKGILNASGDSRVQRLLSTSSQLEKQIEIREVFGIPSRAETRVAYQCGPPADLKIGINRA